MPEFPRRVLRPDDLFKLQFLHDARLSPDGRSVAYVVSRTVGTEESFHILLDQLDGSGRRELAFDGQATYPRWAPDGSRLAFIGAQHGSQRLFVTDPKAANAVPVTPKGRDVQGPPAWSPNGSVIAYTIVNHRRPDGLRRIRKKVFRSEGLGVVDELTFQIGLASVDRSEDRTLGIDMAVCMQPEFSPCGMRILFFGAEAAVGYPSLGGLQLFTFDMQHSRLVEVLDKRWFIAAASWSPCGRRIVYAGHDDSRGTYPMADLWVIECDGSKPICRTRGFTGNIGLRMHHDMPTWGTSQNNVLSVPEATHAYATVVQQGRVEITKIALDGAMDCATIVSGERSCVIMDTNARTSQLLYAASDLFSPWELHLADLDGRNERPVTELNRTAMQGWPTLKVEHLRPTSSDGLPLEAWFVSRADRVGPQPTVMFIHGGPMLSTGHIFRYDFWLLAANGYAVVFGNFRGSAGYGRSFITALFDDFGARGYPDHMAIVNSAVAAGLADPSRLGVWGASHGGFATCWIVGHTDCFRAAVAESAFTNLSTLYYLCDAGNLFVHELGGRPDEIADLYRSRSPLTYAGRCRTPTLMLHGEADLRCPPAEAEQFYRALHDAGCPTELVFVPAMTHMGDSVGPLSAREAQNEALLEWFERHLMRVDSA